MRTVKIGCLTVLILILCAYAIGVFLTARWVSNTGSSLGTSLWYGLQWPVTVLPELILYYLTKR